MILSGPEIERLVKEGSVRIDPFDIKKSNPASFDLTLGSYGAVYSEVVEQRDPKDESGMSLFPTDGILDAAQENALLRFTLPKNGFVLKPGIGYLLHTEEVIWAERLVPVLDGKSSIGRLFTKIHETAGFCDPQFKGQITLEVTVVHKIRIYPGMRIGQVRFHTITGELRPYDGNYTGDRALGPVASRSWKQFADDKLSVLKKLF
jgi:dCTP deaminase